MRLEITCHDCIDMGQKLLGVFVEHNINVNGIEFEQPGKIFVKIPSLKSLDLQKIMSKLRLLEGFLDVITVPFMPSEYEHNELVTLIKAFPDPLISFDAKGNIGIVNNIASSIMGCSEEVIKGQHISQWSKGFNFTNWLDQTDVHEQTCQLKFQEEYFVADLIPITIANNHQKSNESYKQVVAGAVLILKSEARSGQSINAFEAPDENTFSGIQATSRSMRKLIREAKRMSQLDASILIIGETGTGKELLARACHAASERAKKPFMTLNCAALPDDVAESELFGVGEKNQKESKRGIFELADGGSVFLDEVGEMSTKLQSKLLRVIQNGSFRRVDSEKEVTVNVRIISSTNKDLLNLVSLGEFREDLYYRLNVFGLNIPPLRKRRSDILPLTEFFIVRAGQKIGRKNLQLTSECQDFIEHYPWPGNVRQLENVLTRSTSLLEGNEIEIEHLQLPAYTRERGYLEQEFEGTLDAAIKGFEADLLRKLYPAYPSTRQLAKKLGLSHTAIANKLREYDINKNTIKA